MWDELIAVIVGLSDRHTVMADLDNMSFKPAKSLALLTMKRFRLEDFKNNEVHPKHYHVVFDRPTK